MLSLKNVTAGYDGADVVKNVSFNLNKNECLAIIGPNGCGKTTLLRAITRLIDFRGDIYADGISIRNMKPKDLSLKLALLSQMSEIYFSYSVFDTVMMGRYPHMRGGFFRPPSKEDTAAVNAALAAVNLLNKAESDITKLSGGQLQRVFLARTIAQDPEIILLDEPTNHLDLKYQIELIDYLKDWAKQKNRAVIGVLHDINLALRLSDNIMIMKDGDVRAMGKAAEIITGGILHEVYGIDVSAYMREVLGKWTGKARQGLDGLSADQRAKP